MLVLVRSSRYSYGGAMRAMVLGEMDAADAWSVQDPRVVDYLRV